MASASSAACFVYFAGCEGFVKIGIARDVYSRIKTLDTASPWPVIQLAAMWGGEREERLLHLRFEREGLHYRAEWFRREGSLIHLINAMARQPSPRAARGAADQWWEDHGGMTERLGTTKME